MPAKTAIDPFRILPTADAMRLSHDLNRVLDRLTTYISDRYGYNGPVRFHNGIDLGSNPIVNVGSSTTGTNAATVEQIRAIHAQLAAQDAALAAILVQAETQSAAFTTLSDGPGVFSGQAGRGVRVASGEAQLEYVDLVTSLLQLSDIPDSFGGQAGKILRVTADELGMEFVAGSGGVDTFLGLLDAPDSYAGQTGKLVAVNATEDALIFVDPTGGSVTFPIAIAQGGTGATTVPDAQTNLGLVPGTTVQAYDTLLQALAALVTSADTLPYFTGVDTVATTALSATGRTFIGQPDVGAMRTQLGLGDLALLDTVTTAQIDDAAVTFAKMQSLANARLLGRSNSTTGPPHEITIGTGLSLTGGVLTATGGGGPGAATFLDLSDTPNTYVGQATRLVRVNAAADALEFIPVEGLTVTATRTRTLDVRVATSTGLVVDANAWVDGLVTLMSAFWAVPEDYSSGDVTVRWWRSVTTTGGTARMSYTVTRFRVGTTPSVLITTTAAPFTPADSNDSLLSILVAGTGFSAGDMLRIDLARDGLDGADTLGVPVANDGCSVTYVAALPTGLLGGDGSSGGSSRAPIFMHMGS